MRRAGLWLGVGVAVGLLAMVATAQAKEEHVALSKVPHAVTKSIKERFAGAHVRSAKKETEMNGKVAYEVTIRDKGVMKDITVTPEGVIEVIEKEISAKDLPPAVRNTLSSTYPGAKYKVVEETMQVEKQGEQLAYYEVMVVPVGKKAREVKVTGGGKILEAN